MEVTVHAPVLRLFSSTVRFTDGSAVRDVLDRVVLQQLPVDDLYVVTDGRRVDGTQPLVDGAVYHLEPRLLGGKGGFGSMLRALGAQIEKTTNREACRDLSGRRLRDVNHEKEMGEWLKQQTEREAEKEQQRAERLQRKLSEPKHQFSDSAYQQQCHHLSERLEESVLKGLQATSSSQVKVGGASKRASSDQSPPPPKRRTASCFWDGLGELSDDDEASDDGVTTTTPRLSSDAKEEELKAEEEPTSPGDHTEATPPLTSSPRTRLVSTATSSQQLEALGLEALKAELKARGAKCGGTLKERAVRLFAVRGQEAELINHQ